MSAPTEQTYRVATYSHACTAYIRTTLRRALEFHGRDNVWHGTEYVNAALTMTTGPDILPDESVWDLSKTQLMTIHRALEYRQGKRKAGTADIGVSHVVLAEWSFIEAEITRVLRSIWHSEGRYWM